MSKPRRSAGVFEWVFHPAYNKVYAYVERDYYKYLGPRPPSTVEVDGTVYQTSGIVSAADAGWVSALFCHKDAHGSVHNIRKNGFVLDGRSSFSDICYGLSASSRVLIEMSAVKKA